MSAPLSPAEQAVVDRFEVAESAPESLRERVADAMHAADCGCTIGAEDVHRRMAAAAIAVITGGAA